MDRLICQKRQWADQMVCLSLIAFAIWLVLVETLRAQNFSAISRKIKLFTGLIVLGKLKLIVDFLEFR